MGHPRGALRRTEGRLPARGDRSARARRVRGDRARDGRRRELQQRVGGARQAGVGDALRRPPRVRPPHRRLGRLRHRVEGRRRRDALEARRRGRGALQPGLLRGSGGPRPRPDGGAIAEDLGLRDDVGLVRAVHQGAGPAAAAEARGADMGGVGLLRSRLLHRVPHADHPLQTAGRRERPDLGRGGRARRVRHADLRRRRRALRRRRLLRGEGRAGQAPRRRRLHRPQRVRRDDAHAAARAPRRRRNASRSRAASPSASRRSSATRPTSSSSTSAKRPSRHRCSRPRRSGKS